LRDGIRKLTRPGTVLRGKRKNVEVGEGKLFDEPHGIFVVHGGLARKARDDIRTQADSTHRIRDL